MSDIRTILAEAVERNGRAFLPIQIVSILEPFVIDGKLELPDVDPVTGENTKIVFELDDESLDNALNFLSDQQPCLFKSNVIDGINNTEDFRKKTLW
ncbi:MAG: hypothetical protein ACXAEN_27355 [Candidatus Thorarchaeota archaeon]|jgi:hypothetical protein